MESYDIAIIGAGPAGATLARLLCGQASLRVILLDQRKLDEPYTGHGPIKSCGGLLAPDAQKALACMGLQLPREVLADPQIFSVRTIDLATKKQRYYQRFYLNMHREKFDRWLATSAKAAHVSQVFGKLVRDVVPMNGGYRIEFARGVPAITARMVIGADGASSIVRRKLFAKAKFQLYVSIQEVFENTIAPPHFSSYFDPEMTDYYAWSLPKDDVFLLGAAIPAGEGANEKFKAFKEKLAEYGYPLGTPVAREGTWILRPKGMPKALADGKGAFVIGEAAGLISPSSAEGISFGFLSALALYKSICAGLCNGMPCPTFAEKASKAYVKYSRPLRLKVLRKNIKLPMMYNGFLRRMVMDLGVDALKMEK